MTSQGLKLSKQTQSEPLDNSPPVLNIYHALAFLGQKPDKALLDANLDDIWEWAIEHWHWDSIPQKQHILVK